MAAAGTLAKPRKRLQFAPSSNLVVFYSRTGCTKAIALKIAIQIAADVIEIVEDEEELKKFEREVSPVPLKAGEKPAAGSFLRLCSAAVEKADNTPIRASPVFPTLSTYKTVYIGSPVHVHDLTNYQLNLFH